ncbi:hypothetical protein D7X32_24885 [Corallococcus carmarthensis]|uniref:Uncharacterized protein n=1 Tax=Corallococcus carmarthensis TaxID=2316728 RepID=A0A3A8KC29_9BACT|nr:hypothetical protein D7X32_24885 [Corallococcus carmarthensis]
MSLSEKLLGFVQLLRSRLQQQLRLSERPSCFLQRGPLHRESLLKIRTGALFNLGPNLRAERVERRLDSRMLTQRLHEFASAAHDHVGVLE